MAEKTEEKAKTNPVLVVVLLLVLVASGGYLLLNRKSPQVPSGQPATNASAPARVTVNTATESRANEPRLEDDLATFLVRYGRSNPFAPASVIQAQASPNSQQTPQSSAKQPPVDDSLTRMQKQLQNLQPTSSPSASPGSNASGSTADGGARGSDGYKLAGIVRLKTSALAVIGQGQKTYIVGAGDALEKTGYILKAIEEDKVTIVSNEKELVLVLGGRRT